MTTCARRLAYRGKLIILTLVASAAFSACKPSADQIRAAEPPPPPMRETLPEPHPPVQIIPAKPAQRN